jgi:hypothetical protein
MGPWEESMRVQLLREVIHPRFADKGLPQHLHPLNQADNSLIWRQKPHNHRTCSSQCNSAQETCTKLTPQPIFVVNLPRNPQVQNFSNRTLKYATTTKKSVDILKLHRFCLTSIEWERNDFETGCISYGNLRLTTTDLHTWSKITRVQTGAQYTAAVKRTDLTATASDLSNRLDTCKDVSVVSPTTRPPNSFTSLDSGQTTLKHKPTLCPGTEMEIRCV